MGDGPGTKNLVCRWPRHLAQWLACRGVAVEPINRVYTTLGRYGSIIFSYQTGYPLRPHQRVYRRGPTRTHQRDAPTFTL